MEASLRNKCATYISGGANNFCLKFIAAACLSCASIPLSGAALAAGANVANSSFSDELAMRGEYLTNAGNCISCHTQPGAAPFSGGVPFETPLGTLYSSNITPDSITGIGRWTVNDLRRAMHEGTAAGGYRLFPAFPYPEFTKVSDDDVIAIFAYLRTLKAVSYVPPKNGIVFTQRWGMVLWNALFFSEGRFTPDSLQSAELNRGAYLVQGLAHCGACHTPRNFFLAELTDEAYKGGLIQDFVARGLVRRWSAVNLTSARSGLGTWSLDDLIKYLRTGTSPRGATFGPMNDVIVNSLNKLQPEDIRAIAVYLKNLPAQEYRGEPVSRDQAEVGETIYKDRCEKCHSASGRGGMFSGPALAGNPIVQAEDPASLINVIIYGPEVAKNVSYGAWETMPPYGDVLSDSEIAAVCNYIRGSWGNRTSAIKEADVAGQR